MFATDHLTLDAPKRTREGFLAVRARAARTGVYDYAGTEVDPQNTHGLRDKAVVKVLRDDATVFDQAAARSFIGKPVTNDHPAQPVTSANWRDHARGTIMGAMRDGDHLSFDILLTDASAIAAVEGGKRELSNGYATDLEFGQFKAPDGTMCDARQTGIVGNHIAIVDRGRAGPECRIGDAAPKFAACDANPARVAELSPTKEDRVKVINLDGMSVNLSDATAVEQTIAALDNKLTTALADKAAADSKVETLTGEKAALDTQLADAKAASDPAKLDALAADRAALIASAKVAVPTIDCAGKSAAEIRKAVVTAKLGDKAPTTDAAIEGAFAVLTADAAPQVQNIAPRTVIATDASANISTLRAARFGN